MEKIHIKQHNNGYQRADKIAPEPPKKNVFQRVRDFFFPDDTKLKIECETNARYHEGKLVVRRSFYTWRSLRSYAWWYVTKNPYEKAKKELEGIIQKPEYAFKLAVLTAMFLFMGVADIKNISNVTLVAGAIAYDAQASTTGSTSPISFNHTTGGTNRVLVVTTGGLRNPTAVTYNSVSLTETQSVTPFDTSRVEVWTLVGPASGTNSVSVTLASDGSTGVGALSFSGAGGIGNKTGSATLSDTTRTNTLVTNRDNSFVVESQWKDNATSITQNSSQTEVFDNNVGGSRHASAYKQITTAGSNSFQFTGAGSASLIGHALVEVYEYVDPEQLQYAGRSYTAGLSATSVNLSHTVPNDTNRLLVVNIGIHGNATSVTSVTYNGDSLTLANSQVGDSRIYQYYMVAPDVGTANVTVNFSGNSDYSIVAINIVGVDQTDPIGTVGGGTGSSSSPSHSITTEQADSFVVAGVAWGGRSSGAPSATGTNQTARVAIDDGTNGFEYGSSTQTTTTTGSYTSSWSGGVSTGYAHGLIEVKEVNPVVNVTNTPGAQVVTSSVPSTQVNLGIGISPVAQVGNFSLPANSILLGVGISPNAQVGTFSLPTPEILTPDALVSPTTQVATFALETPTLNLDAVIAIANELVATLSLPTPAILQGVGISPDAQVATFSIQTPEFITQIIVEVNVQEGTFSIPTASVAIGIQIEPGAQVGTFSTPVPSILYDMVFGVDPIVATFEVKDPLIRASNYQTKYPVRGNTYGVKYT